MTAPVRVLLVEDHPVMRYAYARSIRRTTDLVVWDVAESAEHALELLAANEGCDLVVTDLTLPGLDGIDLVAAIRALHPTLPTIVTSAHDTDGYQQRAMQAGARACLSKQADADVFLDTIRRVAAGS
jgi:DNA-binding NarL/FixJ family response regulator